MQFYTFYNVTKDKFYELHVCGADEDHELDLWSRDGRNVSTPWVSKSKETLETYVSFLVAELECEKSGRKIENTICLTTWGDNEKPHYGDLYADIVRNGDIVVVIPFGKLPELKEWREVIKQQ